jgi:integrase
MAKKQFNNIPKRFVPFHERHKECRGWVKNCTLSLRNPRSVRDYAESLAQFLEFTKMEPPKLAKLKYDKALALMKRFVLWRVRQKGVSPKTVHRQWFALASFFKFCGIKGAYVFPSRSIPVTIKYLDKIPTKEELRKILQAPRTDLPTLISMHLIAYAGIRPDDISKLTYGCVRQDLEKDVTPCSIYVPQSKTDSVYITFIPEETVRLLKQYLDRRRAEGEDITDASPLLLDHREFRKTGEIKGVLRKNISRKITEAVRSSGVKREETFGRKVQRLRPYSLRKYFRSNLTGHAPSEYIEAWLGHTSGLEHVYGGTRDLDPTTIERMREMYKKCEPFLIATIQPLEQVDVVKEAKIEALKTMARSLLGIDLVEAKVARERELGRELDKDEELELFENELKRLREGTHNPQRIVMEEELERYLEEGWEFVSVLPSQKILVRKE